MEVIEAYADIWCPFAHVGLRTVRDRRRERGGAEVPLRIHAWPLELVNQRPQDADLTAAHIRELRAQVSMDLFVRFDVRSFPTTTLPGLALVAHAYARSDSDGEAVSFALRDALFEEGQDISDRGVLETIASRHGLGGAEAADRDAVLADWHEGQRRGVKGSPHFFCGARDVFCPSLDIGRDTEGHLLIERNRLALDAFLDGCFRD